jgi:uncharacterized protein YutE (UPF0331/DUF86 family)
MEPEELAQTLSALEDARASLLDLKARPWARIVADRHLRNSLERSLEVAAVCMIDVCAHVLARGGHPPAETYREIFQALVRLGRLPSALGSRLEGWAGLRNVLAHRYGRIEMDRLRPVLEHELSDLDEFLGWVADLGAPDA